jgi:methionyl-tRNA synthetase
VLGILLWPVLPGTSEKLQRQLGLQNTTYLVADLDKKLAAGHAVGEVFGLFPRKDQKPA